MRNKSTLKYLTALLLFGSNGILVSHITLNSYQKTIGHAVWQNNTLMQSRKQKPVKTKEK
jgi:hypothetical protein